VLGVAGGCAGAAGVAWGRTGRGAVTGRVDGFGGLVPLGFLGVDVHVEPASLADAHKSEVVGMYHSLYSLFQTAGCDVSFVDLEGLRGGVGRYVEL
jgi:hypothetical protein